MDVSLLEGDELLVELEVRGLIKPGAKKVTAALKRALGRRFRAEQKDYYLEPRVRHEAAEKHLSQEAVVCQQKIREVQRNLWIDIREKRTLDGMLLPAFTRINHIHARLRRSVSCDIFSERYDEMCTALRVLGTLVERLDTGLISRSAAAKILRNLQFNFNETVVKAESEFVESEEEKQEPVVQVDERSDECSVREDKAEMSVVVDEDPALAKHKISASVTEENQTVIVELSTQVQYHEWSVGYITQAPKFEEQAVLLKQQREEVKAEVYVISHAVYSSRVEPVYKGEEMVQVEEYPASEGPDEPELVMEAEGNSGKVENEICSIDVSRLQKGDKRSESTIECLSVVSRTPVGKDQIVSVESQKKIRRTHSRRRRTHSRRRRTHSRQRRRKVQQRRKRRCGTNIGAKRLCRIGTVRKRNRGTNMIAQVHAWFGWYTERAPIALDQLLVLVDLRLEDEVLARTNRRLVTAKL